MIGPDTRVSDREIEEALWHYYYDVEKSVNYLLSMGFESLNEPSNVNMLKVKKPGVPLKIQANQKKPQKGSLLPVSLDFICAL